MSGFPFPVNMPPRKPPSKMEKFKKYAMAGGGGLMMGGIMGSSIVLLHTLISARGPNKFQGIVGKCAQLGGAFGTIFGVGSIVRTLN